MLKKLKNSLVVLFLLGAIVLPLSQSNSFTNSNNNQYTILSGTPKNQHDII
jgi:hypothetical protein